MKTMALRTLLQECSKGRADGLHTDAERDLVELERENTSLREQLRLANDKMDAQVRQARWEVADYALGLQQPRNRESYLETVRDANAPKD